MIDPMSDIEIVLRGASAAIAKVMEVRGMPRPIAAVAAVVASWSLLAGGHLGDQPLSVRGAFLAPTDEDAAAIALAVLLLHHNEYPPDRRLLVAHAVAEAAAISEPAERDVITVRLGQLAEMQSDDIATLVSLLLDEHAEDDPQWARRIDCLSARSRADSLARLDALGLVANGELTTVGASLWWLASWHPEQLG